MISVSAGLMILTLAELIGNKTVKAAIWNLLIKTCALYRLSWCIKIPPPTVHPQAQATRVGDNAGGKTISDTQSTTRSGRTIKRPIRYRTILSARSFWIILCTIMHKIVFSDMQHSGGGGCSDITHTDLIMFHILITVVLLLLFSMFRNLLRPPYCSSPFIFFHVS